MEPSTQKAGIKGGLDGGIVGEGLGVLAFCQRYAGLGCGSNELGLGGGAFSHAHNLVSQILVGLDLAGLLHEQGNGVRVVGGREVPGVLALFSDGEGGDDHVDVAGVKQLAAGFGSHAGEDDVGCFLLMYCKIPQKKMSLRIFVWTKTMDVHPCEILHRQYFFQDGVQQSFPSGSAQGCRSHFFRRW